MSANQITHQEGLTTIDLRCSIRDPRYVAKLIWIALFQHYRVSGDLDYPYEMLCDLATIQRWLEEDIHKNPSFWWDFHNSVHGTWTDINYYHNPFNDTYHVSFKDEDTIFIQFIPAVDIEE